MKTKKSSMLTRRLQKFASNKLAVISSILLIVILLACIFAPLLTSHDPGAMNPRDKMLPPSAEHIFGTDQLGRDVFARILYGGRVSILIGLSSAILSRLLGVALGCVSAFFGGKIDFIIGYIAEFFSCFPQTILIMIIMAFMGQSPIWMVVIFTLTGWTGPMRQVRSKLLSLKEEPFVDSCRANGVSSFSIMFKHLLPNSMGVIIVNVTLSISGYVLSEAGLSFLGLGVSPGTPTWGNIINAAKSLNVMVNAPHMWIFPALAISMFVLCCNFVGDGLRDMFDVSQ